jgi:hypothetical protein
MKKLIYILLSLILFFGCSDEPDELDNEFGIEAPDDIGEFSSEPTVDQTFDDVGTHENTISVTGPSGVEVMYHVFYNTQHPNGYIILESIKIGYSYHYVINEEEESLYIDSVHNNVTAEELIREESVSLFGDSHNIPSMKFGWFFRSAEAIVMAYGYNGREHPPTREEVNAAAERMEGRMYGVSR